MRARLCVLLLIVSCIFVYVESSALYFPAGGCLADGTSIPTMAASQVNNLSLRINQIKNGDTDSRKDFMNREKCLPGGSYYEYRLYPSNADTNRIIMNRVSSEYYFTGDHYESFYKVSLSYANYNNNY